MLLALVSTLLAQEPAAPTPAETAIERGRLLIRDLYEEQALEVLAPYLDDEGLKPSLRGRALVYAGIAQMNIGNEAQGRKLFCRALETDIGAALPEWVSRRVRDVFQIELERVVRARNPPPPPQVTRAQRRPWAGPTMLAGAAVSGALSVFGFVRWSDFYDRYRKAPVAIDAEQLYRAGVPYYWAGDVAAVVGAALIAAALWWWLWPG